MESSLSLKSLKHLSSVMRQRRYRIESTDDSLTDDFVCWSRLEKRAQGTTGGFSFEPLVGALDDAPHSICFTICLCISPDLDGNRAPEIKY
jgi:hypothetical protein